jgi:hypothetical protein
MIHAKPLKRKGLGQLPASPINIESTTLARCVTNAIQTNDSLSDLQVTKPIKKIRVFRQGNHVDADPNRITKGKIVRNIVESYNGLSASEVHYIFLQYCEHKNYLVEDTMIGGTSSYLARMTKDEVIARVKVNNVWYYFRRY